MRIIAIATTLSLFGLPTHYAPRTTPQDVIRRAIDAAGGEAALRGLRNFTTEGLVFNRNLGQEDAPFMPPSANGINIRAVRDRAGRRMRQDLDVKFTGFTQPTRSTQIVRGDAGMISFNGTSRPAPRGLQQGNLAGLETIMPLQLLRMLDNPDSVSAAAPRRIAGQLDEGIRFVTGGAPVTIWFDRTTGLPLLQESVTDDAILGDLTTTITYSHWTRGAVRFPGQTHSESGRGESTTIQRVVSINDSTLSDTTFAISDSLVTAFNAQPPAPAATAPNAAVTVAVSDVAPGILRLAGPSYNAMAVDQGDKLVLVEAPLGSQMMSAIFDTLAARFPGKHIAYVVNTHHHWDHSGGIRSALAAGLPVVTQARNVDFIRSIGTARKTVQPDALSRGRRLPAIIPVNDSLSLGTGSNRVELYPITTTQDGGVHIVAFVPDAGVLFQSDLLNAAPNNRPPLNKAAAAELLAFAQQHGLRLVKVVGGHGEVASIENIQVAAR